MPRGEPAPSPHCLRQHGRHDPGGRRPIRAVRDHRTPAHDPYAATNSTATAISAELASVVGFNPSLALVDELHLLGATPKGAKLVNQAAPATSAAANR